MSDYKQKERRHSGMKCFSFLAILRTRGTRTKLAKGCEWRKILEGRLHCPLSCSRRWSGGYANIKPADATKDKTTECGMARTLYRHSNHQMWTHWDCDLSSKHELGTFFGDSREGKPRAVFQKDRRNRLAIQRSQKACTIIDVFA